MIKKVQNIVSVFMIGVIVVMASGLNIDKHYCSTNDTYDISVILSLDDVMNTGCEHDKETQSCCEAKSTCNFEMDESTCCLDEYDFMLIPVLNQFVKQYNNINISFTIDYTLDFEIPEFIDKNSQVVENINKLYQNLKNTYQTITQVFRL